MGDATPMIKRRTALRTIARHSLGIALLPLVEAANSAPGPKPSPIPKRRSILVTPRSVILFAVMDMFPQCSRGTPDGIDGHWVPTPAQIIQLEKDLPKTFHNPYPSAKSTISPRGDYHQYIGFTRKGRKIIYVNGFSPEIQKEFVDHWKTRPVNVCDGGWMLWGVEYDLANRSFSHFDTNGSDHP